MPDNHRPRLDPRLVFAVLLVAIPVLYFLAQVVLVRPGDCGSDAGNQVGGLSQLVVPGDGCKEQPPGR